MTPLPHGGCVPQRTDQGPRPGDGCPGGVTLQGRTFGLCIRCARLGGREIAPAVDLVEDVATCPNFHQLAMGRLNPAGQSPSLEAAS